MSNTDGGPAYPRPMVPVPGEGVEPGQDGMSKREAYAMAAMPVLLRINAGTSMGTDELIAKRAFMLADAMLSASKSGEGS